MAKKRHVLIIGGTKGAGRAAVGAFTKEGCVVSVIARALPKNSSGKPPRVKFWQADVCDEASVKHALADIVKQRGGLSALVFFQRFRGEGDSWEGELATSLTATRHVIETLVSSFKLKNCAIVLVSSINSALISPQVSAAYHVAKAGLNQLVRYYAVALGARGIRVNCVSPGTFLKPESQAFFLKNKTLVELYDQMIPLGRMCRAEEVARPILFLCGDGASFITGQNLVVDGGLTLNYQESLVRRLLEDPPLPRR